MAFEGLSEKLNATFKHLRGKGRLSEEDIKLAMREVRLALLEADVSYKVVKDFVKTVSERAVGAEVLDSLTPAQPVSYTHLTLPTTCNCVMAAGRYTSHAVSSGRWPCLRK